MEKFSKISPIISLVLILIIFVQTCGNSRKTSIIDRKIQNIESKVENIGNVSDIEKSIVNLESSTIKKEEMENMLLKFMYDILILEEDIDRGVISISSIKKKKIEHESK